MTQLHDPITKADLAAFEARLSSWMMTLATAQAVAIVVVLAVILGFPKRACAEEAPRQAISPPLKCDKLDEFAKARHSGLLKFEDVCQAPQRGPMPWDHCGACGMMNRWDDRLQIWKMLGRR